MGSNQLRVARCADNGLGVETRPVTADDIIEYLEQQESINTSIRILHWVWDTVGPGDISLDDVQKIAAVQQDNERLARLIDTQEKTIDALRASKFSSPELQEELASVRKELIAVQHELISYYRNNMSGLMSMQSGMQQRLAQAEGKIGTLNGILVDVAKTIKEAGCYPEVIPPDQIVGWLRRHFNQKPEEQPAQE